MRNAGRLSLQPESESARSGKGNDSRWMWRGRATGRNNLAYRAHLVGRRVMLVRTEGYPMQRKRLIGVIVALLLAFASVSVASAHPAGQKSVQPYSCFMNIVYSTSRNITINGQVVGSYSGGITQSSCNSLTHGSYIDIYITSTGCTLSVVSGSITINHGPPVSPYSGNGNLGVSNCSAGREIFKYSPFTYTGHYYVCASTSAQYNGVNLGALPSVCHQF